MNFVFPGDDFDDDDDKIPQYHFHNTNTTIPIPQYQYHNTALKSPGSCWLTQPGTSTASTTTTTIFTRSMAGASQTRINTTKTISKSLFETDITNTMQWLHHHVRPSKPKRADCISSQTWNVLLLHRSEYYHYRISVPQPPHPCATARAPLLVLIKHHRHKVLYTQSNFTPPKYHPILSNLVHL